MADTLVVEGVEVKADDTPVGLQFPKDPGAKDREALAGSRKPPEDGKCKRCGMVRRLNRHKMCYPCYVETEIMEREKREGREWIPGDKHPDWCHCEGLGEHKNGDGSQRGIN
jgi:hypothetical protein